MTGNFQVHLMAGQDTVASCVTQVLQALYSRKLLPDMAYQQLYGPRELFVPEAELEAETEAAKKLPSLELRRLDVEWLQVTDIFIEDYSPGVGHCWKVPPKTQGIWFRSWPKVGQAPCPGLCESDSIFSGERTASFST